MSENFKSGSFTTRSNMRSSQDRKNQLSNPTSENRLKDGTFAQWMTQAEKGNWTKPSDYLASHQNIQDAVTESKKLSLHTTNVNSAYMIRLRQQYREGKSREKINSSSSEPGKGFYMNQNNINSTKLTPVSFNPVVTGIGKNLTKLATSPRIQPLKPQSQVPLGQRVRRMKEVSSQITPSKRGSYEGSDTDRLHESYELPKDKVTEESQNPDYPLNSVGFEKLNLTETQGGSSVVQYDTLDQQRNVSTIHRQHGNDSQVTTRQSRASQHPLSSRHSENIFNPIKKQPLRERAQRLSLPQQQMSLAGIKHLQVTIDTVPNTDRDHHSIISGQQNTMARNVGGLGGLSNSELLSIDAPITFGSIIRGRKEKSQDQFSKQYQSSITSQQQIQTKKSRERFRDIAACSFSPTRSMCKVQSRKGHRNIKLMLNKDALNILSHHDNAFGDKNVIGPKRHMKVPEFLETHLSEKRRTHQSGFCTQRTLSPRQADDQDGTFELIKPYLQSESDFQNQGTFKITDLIEYEKSQQKDNRESHRISAINAFQSMQQARNQKISTYGEYESRVQTNPFNSIQQSPNYNHTLGDHEASILQTPELFFQNSTIEANSNFISQIQNQQPLEVSIQPHLEALLENSTDWNKTQALSSQIESQHKTSKDSPRQLEFSPRKRPEPAKQSLNAPTTEITQTRFEYADQGGTTYRDKIRIQKQEEDRRYGDAVKQVKNKYNFDSVDQMRLKHTDEDTFIDSVIGFDNKKKKLLAGEEPSILIEEKSFQLFDIPTAIDETREEMCQESIESRMEERKQNVNMQFESERKAWKKLPKGFKLDIAPDITHEMFCDLIAQFTKEEEVDLYSPRIDGYLDNLREIETGLNKYMTLVLDGELAEARKEFGHVSDHQTSEEEEERERKRVQGPSGGEDEAGQAKMVKVISPLFEKANLPDFVITALKIRSKKEASKDGQAAVRGPILQGTHRDPMQNAAKRDAYAGKAEFWKRKMYFRLTSEDTLTILSYELEFHEDAMQALQKGVEKYAKKAIAKVLPLSMFDDYKQESIELKAAMVDRRKRNKAEFTIKGLQQDSFGDESIVHGTCQDYIPEQELFIVNFNGFRYVANRLRISFDYFETAEEAKSRQRAACQLQQEAFQRMNYERIFIEEVIRILPTIRIPPSILLNIVKKGKPKKAEASYEQQQKLARQVESSYAFALLKLQIVRELEVENPKVTCLIRGYKSLKSSALDVPYYGLASYEKEGKPIDLTMTSAQLCKIHRDYSLLGRDCFNETSFMMNSLRLDVLEDNPVYEIPLSRRSLSYLVGLDEYSNYTQSQIQSFTTEFPLKAALFNQVQSALADRFRQTLTGNWQIQVLEQVEHVLKKYFKLNKEQLYRVVHPQELNPFVVRFLKQVHSIQVSHLCQKQYAEMKNFLDFLIRFVQQNQKFKRSFSFEAYHLDKILIPISDKPLLTIDVQIDKKKIKSEDKKQTVKSKSKFRQVLTTEPKLEQVYISFIDMAQNLQTQFRDLTRIEKMIFPNLVLSEDPTLSASVDETLLIEEESEELVEDDEDKSVTGFSIQEDDKEIERLKVIKQQIGRSLSTSSINLQVVNLQTNHIIDKVMQMADQKIMSFSVYLKYLNYDFYEDIIKTMKKKLYDENLVKKLQEDKESFANDSQSSVDYDKVIDEQADVDDAAGQDDEEHSNIQIDEQTYLEQYNKLKNKYWQVRVEVSDVYNFGLVQLDCRKFKEATVQKISDLLHEFEQHLLREFKVILLQKWSTNENIWSDVAKDWGNDIEMSIKQMQIIMALHCDETYENLTNSIYDVKQKKKFLDKLQIPITEKQFDRFLSLYAFPQKLRDRVYEQFDQTEANTRRIKLQIQKKADDANEKIGEFELRLNEFLHCKVFTEAELRAAFKGKNRHTFNALLDAAQQDAKIYDKKTGELFVWQSDYVNDWVEKKKILTQEVNEVKAICDTVMRQQEALSLPRSSFKNLSNLTTNIMPTLDKVWKVIGAFNEKFFSWWTTHFPLLNVDEMEELNTEWIHKLNEVKKDNTVTKGQPVVTFIEYIADQLEKLREFMTIIRALKTKGLERRHFTKMEKELEDIFKKTFSIAPNKMDLKYLAQADLHKGEAVEIIKKISSQAQKEYAIRVSLDQIDVELNDLCLQFQSFSDSYVFNNIDQDMMLFRDAELKMTTIAQNAYAKYYESRVQQMSKEIRTTIDFYKNWKQIIKYWAYLIPVFKQDDIHASMPDMCKRFDKIDDQYQRIVAHALDCDPMCYRSFARLAYFPTQSDAMCAELDVIMFNVNRYLIMKRRNFARLYFLSNDELMDMVANAGNEIKLQNDLHKLFPGIHKLKFKVEVFEVLDYQRSIHDSNVSASLDMAREDSKIGRKGAKVTKKKRKAQKVELEEEEGSVLPVILGITNEQGEEITFTKPVTMSGTLDDWCGELETQMKESVHASISEALYEGEGTGFMEWMRTYPTQICLVALDVRFTQKINALFEHKTVELRDARLGTGAKKKKKRPSKEEIKAAKQKLELATKNMLTELDWFLKRTLNNYQELTKAIKEQSNDHWRLKISNLVCNRIHVRDMIRNYQDSAFEQGQDFLSQIQLKYVFADVPCDWDLRTKRTLETEQSGLSEAGPVKKNLLILKCFHVFRIYGYEYLPNSLRLVITPLTERVFQSLFLAMHYDYGGAPYGPAGTGKTETVKDLAKRVARCCFVFNCNSSMEVGLISELLSGVVACGYWSCFDEFNRIDACVLSVLSTLFVKVHQTKLKHKTTHTGIKEVELEGKLVPFKDQCGIFVTLNPYALGRTNLPSNLKNLFRIVTMIVPDSTLIAQIVLMNAGFDRAKILSGKIIRTFSLTCEQIPFQRHYDFGLRAIKAVLDLASSLKLKALRITNDVQAKKDQANLAIQGHVAQLKKMKLAKVGQKKELDKKKELMKNLPTGNLMKRMKMLREQVKKKMAEEKKLLDQTDTSENESGDSGSEDGSGSDMAIYNADQGGDGDHMKYSFVPSRPQKRDKLDYDFIRSLLDPDNDSEIRTEAAIEEFIVFKAIRDVQLPRLSLEDQVVFQNICTDIFPSAPKPVLFQTIKVKDMFPERKEQEDKPGRSRPKHDLVLEATNQNVSREIKFRIRDTVETRLTEQGLFYGDLFILRVIQLYESIQAQKGIMVVGAACSGKTQLVKVTIAVAKILHKMEFNKRQKAFLRQKATKMGIPYTEEEKGDGIKLDTNDAFVTKAFLPTADEKKLLSATQIFHDFVSQVINPKSMDHEKFFGVYNTENNEWTDGCITKMFRTAAANKTDKIQLLVIDGPIEPNWAENLNSVMDDNKKLSFGAGEFIPVGDNMKVVFEASDLQHTSPATVSRCNIVFMEEGDEILPLKAHVNKWILSLPPILMPELDRLDMVINYFLINIRDYFCYPYMFLHPVSKKQLVTNFTQIFECQLHDYRNPKYERADEILKGYKESEKPHDWGDYVLQEEQRKRDEEGAFLGEEKKKEPWQVEHDELPDYKKPSYRRKWFPTQKFADSEQGFIDSIRFKTYWLHSFFLFSLIWSFGVALKEDYKAEFAKWLMQNATVEGFHRRLTAKKSTGLQSKRITGISNLKKQKSVESESGDSMASYQPQMILQDDLEAGQYRVDPTPQFFTGQLTALKSRLPSDCQCIFSIFFDIECSDWLHWDTLRSTMSDPSMQMRLLDSQHKSIFFHNYWLTTDGIRYTYLLDRFIQTGFNTLVIGPSGVGKTMLVRNYAVKRLKDRNIQQKFFNMTGNTRTEPFKQALQHGLIRTKKQPLVLRHKEALTQLYFIEDLNMCPGDEWGIKGPHELLRLWFDYQGWYDIKTREFNKVKSLQLAATCSLADASHYSTKHLNDRLIWHWATITMVNLNQDHLKEIYTAILKYVIPVWDPAVRGQVKEITEGVLKSSFAFFQYLDSRLPNTPDRFTKKVNQRHIMSCLFGLIDCHNKWKRSIDEIAQVFIHEMARATLDRIVTEEKQTAYDKLVAIVSENFQFEPKKKRIDADRPFYSYLRQDQTEFYHRMVGDCKQEFLTLQDTIDLYNQINYRSPIHVTLFSFILENIVKTNRALRQPWPGTILLAQEGCGADKITKLALLITKYSTKEFSSTLRNFFAEKWQTDLKAVMNVVALDPKPMVLTFQERELVTEEVLADLEAFMAHGELMCLYSAEELDGLIEKLKLVTASSQQNSNTKPDEAYLEEMKVILRENLKVMITLTPTSHVFRIKLGNYSHILNCSTVLYMGDWGDTGLELVAEGVLAEKVDRGYEDGGATEVALVLERKDAILKAMVGVYKNVKDMIRKLYQQSGVIYYISPSHFEHFCKAYKKIYLHMEVKYTIMQQNFEKGLQGIKVTEDQIEAVQEELSKLSPQLVAKQHELEKMLGDSGTKKEAIGKKMELLMLEEKVLNYYLTEGHRARENCHAELGIVIPILNKAVTGLQQLNKYDIDELRSMKHPPRTIVDLLQAVCIILKVKPKMVPVPGKINEYDADYWTVSVSSHVLGSRDILSKLSAIEPTSLDQEVMSHLEKLMDSDSFQFVQVERSCAAAQGLFMWVKAVRNYYYVYKLSEGYRDKVIKSDLQDQKLEAIILEKRKEIDRLSEELESIKVEVCQKEEAIKKFQKEIDDCYIRKSRAARLIDALSGEKHKWATCKLLTEHKLFNLEGDCLLCAAVVIYLAPFDQRTRETYAHRWTKIISELKINVTKKLVFNSHYVSNFKIQNWIEKGLPNDSFSIQSAIIDHFCDIQTVALDPQSQAKKWLQAMNAPLVNISQDTQTFVKQMKLALGFGQTVIIDNLGDTISRVLYPIIKEWKQKKVVGKENEINLAGKMVPLHLDFGLVLATAFPRPDYGPEISEYVILVNFALTEGAFDAQIMAVIIQEIDLELDVNMRVCKQECSGHIKDIKNVELQILKMLASYDRQVEAMIANEDLIESLQQSQMLQDKIGEGLKEIGAFQYKINAKKKDYTLLTRRATKLFFLVAGFNKISPMYQFTHQWFFSIFLDVLRDEMKDKTLDDLKLEEGAFGKIMERFTLTFFQMVCQQIFEKDKMLFSFMLAYKQMEAATNIDFRLVKFFIIGPLMKVARDKEAQKKTPAGKGGKKSAKDLQLSRLKQISNFSQKTARQMKKDVFARRKRAVPWMKKEQWKLVDKLSLITPFNQINPHNDTSCLAQHLEDNQQDWYDYIYKDRREEEKLQLSRRKSNLLMPADPDDLPPESLTLASDASSEHKLPVRPSRRVAAGAHEMPGGYESFNYEQAWERQKEDKRIENHVVKQIGSNVTLTMRGEYFKKPQAIRDEYELDEMFAAWKSSSEDSDSSDDRRGNIYAEDSEDRLFNALSDQQNPNRKGNLQDELEIAEAIVHGIAQYSEFDVKAEEKEKPTEFKDMRLDTSLIKLCIFRCFRPDRLNGEIRRFIKEFAGDAFTDIPSHKFDLVHQQSSRFRPILILQGDNVDAREELQRIRKQNPTAQRAAGLQILSCGSQNYSKMARTIIRAAATGGWVLIDNVHLDLGMLSALLQFLGQLVIMHCNFASHVNKTTSQLHDAEVKKDQIFGLDSGKGGKLNNLRGNISLQNQLRDQQKKDDLYEKARFPHGRANFAQDEDKFLMTSEKPEFVHDKVKSMRAEKIQEKWDYVRRELEDYERLLDNPDKGYDDVVHQKSPDEKDLENLLFPRKWEFYMKKTFRLFVSSLPLDDFPATFARKCTKMALEMPNSVQRIAKKNFDNITEAQLTSGGCNPDAFRKLLVSVTVMHAMISRKELYNSFGWSKPGYQFSPNDFDITVSQLCDIFTNLDEYQRVPCDLIHHILTYLNYGSVVTNQQDLHNLYELIRAFVHKDMFVRHSAGEDAVGYDLTGAQLEEFKDNRARSSHGLTDMDANFEQDRGYRLPGKVKDKHMMQDILGHYIPVEDQIALFGLSEAANFKAKGESANGLMDKVFEHNFTLPFPSGATLAESIKNANISEVPADMAERELADIRKYHSFIRKFEEIIDELEEVKIGEEVETGSEQDYTESGLSACFNKEARQYMDLIARIQASVRGCIDVLHGLRTEDATTAKTFIALQSNRTPEAWTVHCYAAFITLSTFIDNLLERVRYIKALIHDINHTQEEVRVFKLPYFYDQRALITTLLQLVSRKSAISIEKLKPLYRVMQYREDQWDEKTSAMTNSFYLEGLFLNGARWSMKDGSIDECIHPHQVSNRLPTIHMLIQKTEEERELHSQTAITPTAMKTKNLMDVVRPQVQTIGKKMDMKGAIIQRQELRILEMVRKYKDQLVGCQLVEIPMYVTARRNRVFNLGMEDDFMIMKVPLPTKYFQPGYFIRRNIALLCYSDELV